jgi:hypothetical protein
MGSQKIDTEVLLKMLDEARELLSDWILYAGEDGADMVVFSNNWIENLREIGD